MSLSPLAVEPLARKMATDTKRLVAAVYARRSHEQNERDEDSKSITRQVERAKEFAAKMGWQFDDRYIFSDEEKGDEWAGRTGWNALRRAIGAGDQNAP